MTICKYYEKCGVDCCGDSGEVDIENCKTADCIHTLEYGKATFKAAYYNLKNKLKDKLAYYEDLQGRCSVFTSEFTIYNTAIQILKELLGEDNEDRN